MVVAVPETCLIVKALDPNAGFSLASFKNTKARVHDRAGSRRHITKIKLLCCAKRVLSVWPFWFEKSAT